VKLFLMTDLRDPPYEPLLFFGLLVPLLLGGAPLGPLLDGLEEERRGEASLGNGLLGLGKREIERERRVATMEGRLVSESECES
jgi:hypothetical protein